MKKTILFSLFMILINTMGWAGSNNIIILKSEFTNRAELDSLSAILTRKANSIKIIDIKDVESRILDRASVVIYHRSDSAGINTQEINLKKELLRYVKNGGSLLLTMDGVRLMNEWNIEPEPLQIEYQDATDGGFGRAVGFHGYREHPVYDGLYGGAYTWKATVDHFARTIGFSDTKVPRAAGSKVVGINWAYIQYHENRKLVWETPVGKGRILSIGGYLYFSRPNVNRAVCDIFINNCVGYLSGKKSETSQKYWQYDTITTARVPFESLNITAKTEPIWKPVTSSMEHSRMGAKDNYWNVSGQQLLAMGKEPGGIDEIWIHPLMALRDLTVGVKYKGSNDIFWLNNMIPTVIKRPESFERIYTLNDGTTLREYMVASLTDPLLVVRYDWENKNVDRIFVCYTSNLRLMWPYSLESTGTLFYSQSNDGTVAYLFDRAKQLNMVTAFDRSPITYKSGECDFKNKNIEQFNTIKAKHKQVSFLYEFSGDDKSLNFYLSGGEMGLEQSAYLINQNMGGVEKLNKKANSYFNSFDKNLLSISSSDSLFNEAYRWALISTDKFYCYTPSLGSSLMSGYFTTARGWNGGHEVSGRPGYAWYFGRDTELSSMALSSIGDFRKVREILRTFGKYQAPEGKIYHELTTSGSVHYDASDATPLYVALAGYYLKRSGDIEFIRQEWDKIAKAMDFCYSTDTDGDLLIENTNVGHGWQECYQLYGAHTEVYLASCWAAALRESAYMATMLGKKELGEHYKKDMDVVVYKINKNFWNEKSGFYNHGLMKDGTYQEEKCVLGGTPLLFGLSEPRKAVTTAENFSSKYYSTDWGVRMVGYNSPYYAIGGYNYGNIWPFFTGCASLEEFKAGLYMQGFRHTLGNLKNYIYWDYGNLPEVIAGDALQFSGICTHQQWSSAMSVLALTDGMLGLEADAFNNSLSLAPAFPVDWNSASVKNIYIGQKVIHLTYKQADESYFYSLNSSAADKIKMNFTAILPLATQITAVHVNGKDVEFEASEMVQNIKVEIPAMVLHGKDDIGIFTKGGIGVFHNLHYLKPYEKDIQLKIEKERFDPQTQTYQLILAGVPGESYDVEVFERSQVKKIEGATLKEKQGVKSIYTITFPKEGTEPFINKDIRLSL